MKLKMKSLERISFKFYNFMNVNCSLQAINDIIPMGCEIWEYCVSCFAWYYRNRNQFINTTVKVTIPSSRCR